MCTVATEVLDSVQSPFFCSKQNNPVWILACDSPLKTELVHCLFVESNMSQVASGLGYTPGSARRTPLRNGFTSKRTLSGSSTSPGMKHWSGKSALSLGKLRLEPSMSRIYLDPAWSHLDLHLCLILFVLFHGGSFKLIPHEDDMLNVRSSWWKQNCPRRHLSPFFCTALVYTGRSSETVADADICCLEPSVGWCSLKVREFCFDRFNSVGKQFILWTHQSGRACETSQQPGTWEQLQKCRPGKTDPFRRKNLGPAEKDINLNKSILVNKHFNNKIDCFDLSGVGWSHVGVWPPRGEFPWLLPQEASPGSRLAQEGEQRHSLCLRPSLRHRLHQHASLRTDHENGTGCTAGRI